MFIQGPWINIVLQYDVTIQFNSIQYSISIQEDTKWTSWLKLLILICIRELSSLGLGWNINYTNVIVVQRHRSWLLPPSPWQAKGCSTTHKIPRKNILGNLLAITNHGSTNFNQIIFLKQVHNRWTWHLDGFSIGVASRSYNSTWFNSKTASYISYISQSKLA